MVLRWDVDRGAWCIFDLGDLNKFPGGLPSDSEITEHETFGAFET